MGKLLSSKEAFFYSGNQRFTLIRPLVFKYLDWHGVSAGLYVEDSVHPGAMLRFSPVLEEDDVSSALVDFANGLAGKYTGLKATSSSRTLKSEEREELGLLEGLFAAA